MRTADNPLRGEVIKDSKYPKRIAAIITHLPDITSEYHAPRFEVVKLCLTSMRAGAPDIPVMIWDNGSCKELRDWMLNEFKPEFITLSSNVGKWSGRHAIAHMFSHHTLLGISDDDMLFYPNWFSKSEEVLRHFPNTGIVSCYPVRTQFRWGTEYTITWGKIHGTVSAGKFIPSAWDKDFCNSIGRDRASHLDLTRNEKDIIISYQGMEAYATAHHCQFIGYSDIIGRYTTWTDEALNDEKIFDDMIGRDHLRLTTTERLCRHIGNAMDQSIIEDAEKLGLLTRGF
jgi:hypothetical protein